MIQLKSGTFTRTQFINTVNKARKTFSDRSFIGINAVVADHIVVYRAVGTFIKTLTVDGVNHSNTSNSISNSEFRDFIKGALK